MTIYDELKEIESDLEAGKIDQNEADMMIEAVTKELEDLLI